MLLKTVRTGIFESEARLKVVDGMFYIFPAPVTLYPKPYNKKTGRIMIHGSNKGLHTLVFVSSKKPTNAWGIESRTPVRMYTIRGNKLFGEPSMRNDNRWYSFITYDLFTEKITIEGEGFYTVITIERDVYGVPDSSGLLLETPPVW